MGAESDLLKVVESQVAQGALETAVITLRERLSARPAEKTVRLRLVELLSKIGKTEEAKNVAEAGHKVLGEDVDIASAAARIAIFQGDVDRAKTVLNNALMVHDDGGSATIEYLNLLLANAEYGEALEVGRAAADKAPRSAALHAAVGDALVGLGNFYAALEAFKRARACDRFYFGGTAWVARGDKFLEGGADELAEEAYQIAAAEEPRSSTPLRRLGDVWRRRGNNEKALGFYLAAARRPDRNISPLLDAGSVALDMRDYEEALKIYSRACNRDPSSGAAHIGRGLTMDGLGKLEEAAAAFEHAAQLDPSNSEAHIYVGNTLYDLKRYADSIRSYDRAIRARRTSIWGHLNKAIVLEAMGRKDEALDAIESGLRELPAHGELLSQRVWLLEELGRVDEAKVALEKALGISHDDIVLHALAVNFLWDRGEEEAAKNQLKYALTLSRPSEIDKLNLIEGMIKCDMCNEALMSLAELKSQRSKGDVKKVALYFEASLYALLDNVAKFHDVMDDLVEAWLLSEQKILRRERVNWSFDGLARLLRNRLRDKVPLLCLLTLLDLDRAICNGSLEAYRVTCSHLFQEGEKPRWAAVAAAFDSGVSYDIAR